MSAASRAEVRIAVIGAGLGGIALGVKLARAGFGSFTIYEAASGPGGTWWLNVYPGAEVDVPSHVYSYSFMPYDWSRTHARQSELQGYVEAVIDRFGIRDRIRLDTPVSEIRWDDAAARYTVRTRDGSEAEYDIVVSAVGMLSDPRMPDWPGLADFRGKVVHTARWPPGIDLAGKRVALIGTGSSACQVGPAIAPVTGHLDVYQREPGYVLPKRERDFTAGERSRYRRHPLLRRWRRLALFHEGNRSLRAFDTGNDENARLRAFCVSYIARKVDDPAVRTALTPQYPYGCKRPVFASDWYPMFNRPNVALVPHAVAAVTPDGVVDDLGVERPADLLVLATGFQATNYLSTLEVYGRGGRSLHEEWGDEPKAFLGMTVPGYPNFFMLYGPNSNGGWSILAQLERQAEAVVKAARRIVPGHRAIDTRRAVTARYNDWLSAELIRSRSAMEGACHNYYHAPTGRNVTQWPRSHPWYFLATKTLPVVGWRQERTGQPADLPRRRERL